MELSRKPLNAPVSRVGHEDREAVRGVHVRGLVEQPFRRAAPAEGGDDAPARVELHHDVAPGVGHEEVARRVHRHRPRILEPREFRKYRENGVRRLGDDRKRRAEHED